jgi:hypothetical protein
MTRHAASRMMSFVGWRAFETPALNSMLPIHAMPFGSTNAPQR